MPEDAPKPTPAAVSGIGGIGWKADIRARFLRELSDCSFKARNTKPNLNFWKHVVQAEGSRIEILSD
jgi:hypothetical protein